jgi:transcriptional regulator with XRE-family HTH domain
MTSRRGALVVDGSEVNADDADGGGELAARLNKLFEVIRRPGEAPLSNAAVAAAIADKTGVSISTAYLWQLRAGKATNPRITHLRAIAEFFGISPSYLIDTDVDPKITAQLELLAVLRDAGVRDLAMRASGLTPAAIDSLRAMVDHARHLEKLPPVASPRGRDGDDE